MSSLLFLVKSFLLTRYLLTNLLPLCSRLFAILLLLHSFSWLALLFYYHSFDLKTKEMAGRDGGYLGPDPGLRPDRR